MQKIKQLLLFIVLLLPLSVVAQNPKTISVKKSIGRWEVSNDITPKQAEELAILEAKKEALRSAGVVENVWSVFSHVAKDNNNQFFESANELSSISINGLVRVTSQKITDEYDPARGVLTKIATLSCEVIDDNSSDPEFEIEVTNVNSVYSNGVPLSFTVKVHNRDAYLKIFWFDSDNGEMLYPNTSEPEQLLQAGKTYTFPLNQTIDYQVVKDPKSTLPVHQNNLLFVATRDAIPYIGTVDFKTVIEWTFKIPTAKRATAHKLFIIR